MVGPCKLRGVVDGGTSVYRGVVVSEESVPDERFIVEGKARDRRRRYRRRGVA